MRKPAVPLEGPTIVTIRGENGGSINNEIT
jgi:hypothetical protein